MGSSASEVRVQVPAPPAHLAMPPAPPTLVAALPVPPVLVIDAALIPIIRPFLHAAAAGAGAGAALFGVRVWLTASAAGAGSLDASLLQWRVPSTASGSTSGSAGTRIAVRGTVLGTASASATGAAGARVALRIRAASGGVGATEAVLVPTVAVQAIASATGAIWANVPQTITAAATGTTTADVTATGPVLVAAVFGGTGDLAPSVLPSLSVVAGLSTGGELGARARASAQLATEFTTSGAPSAALVPVGRLLASAGAAGTLTAYAVPGFAYLVPVTGSGALSAVALDADTYKFPALTSVGMVDPGRVDVATGPIVGGGEGAVASVIGARVGYTLEFTGKAGVAVGPLGVVTPAPITGTATTTATVVQAGVTVTDNFNRADLANLGTSYTVLGESPVIASNRAQADAAPINTVRVYAARHNTALLTDTQEITFTVINPFGGAAALELGGGCFLRSTSTGTRVEALLTSNQATIMTRINGTANSRKSAPIATPSAVRFTAVGKTYSIYVNGSATPAVTWNDDDNAIAIGSANRFFGVVFVGQTSITNQRGYAVDDYTARDL